MKLKNYSNYEIDTENGTIFSFKRSFVFTIVFTVVSNLSASSLIAILL